MLFNSYIFLFLLWPLAFGGYFILNKFSKYTQAKGYLVAMSLWFYGYFNYKYLFIILGSIAFNYLLNLVMQKCEAGKNAKKVFLNCSARKLLLIVGLTFNISLLFAFKYYDFFVQNMNLLFKANFTLYHIALPLGISFFTFQQLSFVMDCYRNSVPKYNFIDYMLFVTFFPQLIAGPIVLHSEVIPQFENKENKHINYDNLAKAITSFAIGLSKKVILADTLGLYVNSAFENISNLNVVETVVLVVAAVLNIYFDFSGYCDMAMGIGYSFNIKLPVNFDSPYKSLSIQEFWKKWHITLGRFLTWYVYFPLAISKGGTKREYLNLMIVFLISGIWHGAGWNFILFGLIYGVASVAERAFHKQFLKLGTSAKRIYTLAVVSVATIIFRCSSLEEIGNVFTGLVNFSSLNIREGILSSLNLVEITTFVSIVGHEPIVQAMALALTVLIGIFIVFKTKNTNEIVSANKLSIATLLSNAVLIAWSIVSLEGVSQFLYFDF